MSSIHIKIIALDLDNTLLNSQKELSPGNRAALMHAARQGMEIVPATGRFFNAMPESIRTLPFLHYAITINGAQVYDLCRDCAVARSEIPTDLALDIMTELDRFPVIYDCYRENRGFMTAAMQKQAETFVSDPIYLKMLRELREPVSELKDYLHKQEGNIQKIQLFTADPALRIRLLRELPDRFPNVTVTSSVPCNVEINAKGADKGTALHALADYLNVDMADTVAIGDGMNDISMLRSAGIGVAMCNACPEALNVADRVTGDCDADGVAAILEEFLSKNESNVPESNDTKPENESIML